jgi:hypothetical protein
VACGHLRRASRTAHNEIRSQRLGLRRLICSVETLTMPWKIHKHFRSPSNQPENDGHLFCSRNKAHARRTNRNLSRVEGHRSCRKIPGYIIPLPDYHSLARRRGSLSNPIPKQRAPVSLQELRSCGDEPTPNFLGKTEIWSPQIFRFHHPTACLPQLPKASPCHSTRLS